MTACFTIGLRCSLFPVARCGGPLPSIISGNTPNTFLLLLEFYELLLINLAINKSTPGQRSQSVRLTVYFNRHVFWMPYSVALVLDGIKQKVTAVEGCPSFLLQKNVISFILYTCHGQPPRFLLFHFVEDVMEGHG